MAEPTRGGDPESPRPRAIGLAGAQILAWALLAIVNAFAIALRLPMPPEGRGVRAFHHLYDAGHLLAIGLAAAAAVELAASIRARAPRLRHPIWSYGAIAAIAIALGAPALDGDLTGAAASIFGQPRAAFGMAALTAAAGLAIAGFARLGRLLARPRLRLAGVALGLAGGITNHFVLENDYPGIHLFIACSSATLIGASLAGASWPFELSSRATSVLRAALASFAAWSLVVIPKNSVAVELLHLPGAALAPFLPRLRAADIAPWRDRGEPPSMGGPDRPPSEPPLVRRDAIVIFLVIDALRADVLAGGKRGPLLPELDLLRRGSIEFTRARSPASGTIWAISSIFSGRYYSDLYWTVKPGGASAKPYPHEDSTLRFPEVLSRAGIATMSVSEMPDVTNDHGVVRGFTEQRNHVKREGVPASTLMSEVLKRLVAPGGAATPDPLFVYAHFLEPHAPYDRAGKRGDAFERYLREIGIVDHELGRLRKTLLTSGLAGRVVLIVTADHGEAFGEHGTHHHAVSVYDELLRVPLFIQVPGVSPRQVDRDVTLMDIGPTVLDLMGQPTPGGFLGESLVPYLRGQDPVLARPIVAETGRFQQAMVFPDGFKMIRDRRRGTFELYDLKKDPGELDNLFERADVDAGAYLDRLHAFFAAHTLRRPGYRIPYRP